MVKRVLGSSVTDSNGQVSVSYVGKGSGVLSIQCECMSLSKTYGIVDAVFYDEATTNAKAPSYNKFDNTIEVTYDTTNGTTLTRASESYSSTYRITMNNTVLWRDANKNYCIECDVSYENDATSGGSLNVYFGGQSIPLLRLNNNLNSGTGHLKLITDGDTVKPYWNDTHISAQDKTMSSLSGFEFGFYRKCKVTFKDLKIYLI